MKSHLPSPLFHHSPLPPYPSPISHSHAIPILISHSHFPFPIPPCPPPISHSHLPSSIDSPLPPFSPPISHSHAIPIPIPIPISHSHSIPNSHFPFPIPIPIINNTNSSSSNNRNSNKGVFFTVEELVYFMQKLFTVEELALYNGTDDSLPILLGILGSVFEVKKEKSHYGAGGGYNHFAGRDASRAFVSGNFTGAGLTDSLRGLSSTEVMMYFLFPFRGMTPILVPLSYTQLMLLSPST
ncbi:uncharacterized protein LOC105794884 [Gossypium raimondii]|uniref:uncharacterized protein LOC105794884 n=1 Tax=Gossypium raimondii TaxID=29730 RepID=UPI002279FBFF|nr:uncharacterized protein LOC105794884 [Gossypium raimondii]